MTTPQKREATSFETDAGTVTDFLKFNLGLYYCNDCLYEETRIKSPCRTSQNKRLLSTIPQDYDQAGICDSCGNNRKSLAFLPGL